MWAALLTGGASTVGARWIRGGGHTHTHTRTTRHGRNDDPKMKRLDGCIEEDCAGQIHTTINGCSWELASKRCCTCMMHASDCLFCRNQVLPPRPFLQGVIVARRGPLKNEPEPLTRMRSSVLPVLVSSLTAWMNLMDDLSTIFLMLSAELEEKRKEKKTYRN